MVISSSQMGFSQKNYLETKYIDMLPHMQHIQCIRHLERYLQDRTGSLNILTLYINSNYHNKKFSLKCVYSFSDLFFTASSLIEEIQGKKSYLNKEADDFNEVMFLKGSLYFN